MQKFHNQTDITVKNSFEQTQFIDWRTQAKDHKSYPKFFRRFNIDEFNEIKFIKNFGNITNTKKYANEEVYLRTNPSAGGLYPCEVYIQIRGVKGLLSGIYHYEPLTNTLALIHELSNDGIEYYFKKNSSKKFIFLISNVYFRSSWKYEKRAIRYLLLDTGHQLGSIYVALKIADLEHDFCFDFDKNLLNKEFGFDNSEFFQGAILIDNKKDTKSKKLREKLVSVSATDYQIKEPFIEDFAASLEKEKYKKVFALDFLNTIQKKELQKTINNRRSVRVFKKESIQKEEYEFILKDIFEFALLFDIELFFINNNINGLEKGIYKNVTLLQKGEYKDIATKLAFNQKLAGTSAFTLFYTSNIESNYVQNYILSGFIAHIISLKARYLNIGSSGIGAYFDDECQNILKTTNNILYLQAIGR